MEKLLSLHEASLRGNKNIVKSLLINGASFNVCNALKKLLWIEPNEFEMDMKESCIFYRAILQKSINVLIQFYPALY